MSDMNIYNLLMIVFFAIGYFLITIEHVIKINKTSIALLMAISGWTLQFLKNKALHEDNMEFLSNHLSDISEIVVFLLSALAIVAIINAHKGFILVSKIIRLRSKRQLLWLMGFLSFFLSAILDNLTTTIIMVTLLGKLVAETEDRLILGGAVVIAANAGGAWTPIGDVTTTMLWIGGQISAYTVMTTLFLPSLACLIASLICLSCLIKGRCAALHVTDNESIEPAGILIFWLGILALIFIPIFKSMTGLPPFMGIILGLGVIWLVTDYIHGDSADRAHLRMPAALKDVDLSSILFFLGILLSIDSLHTAGILDYLAHWMDKNIVNADMIAITIGLASAVVDNVPLVAATMGMYSLDQYPEGSHFWNLIAYCAGTGGSILVIGSAAGIAYMGLERVRFFWYFRRIGIAAFVGYFAGIGVFKLTTM